MNNKIALLLIFTMLSGFTLNSNNEEEQETKRECWSKNWVEVVKDENTSQEKIRKLSKRKKISKAAIKKLLAKITKFMNKRKTDNKVYPYENPVELKTYKAEYTDNNCDKNNSQDSYTNNLYCPEEN